MSAQVNRQIRLAERPTGLPGDSTWKLTEEDVPVAGDGELLVSVEYLSLDPAMRGYLNDVPSYAPPVEVGAVMRAAGVGVVVESRNPAYAVGERVIGAFGVQEHAVSDGRGLSRVDTSVAPAPTWLGLLGYPGLTAYFGLFDVGRAQAGDTVVVSGAAGAVGSVVGQLAKVRGCRVVGIAGGAEKCAWLRDELGFDATIDYKSERVGRALHAAAPDGVDVYFDNVGGPVLDNVLAQLRRNARVVICGAISQYNRTEAAYGPKNYLSLIVNRASMAGMLVFDYVERFPEAIKELAGWYQEGKLISREQVVSGGVTEFPEALRMLFAGANTGKLVLEV
ncbi:NADP-dependent oxidoreductase [Umezawaea sp. NPDC059074]|uniref:NADP-dependent oxidoreductase n=1 Tax=Umezawaea sp. NPDC059074 TaxID=3346716 RepID=UPI0036982F4E